MVAYQRSQLHQKDISCIKIVHDHIWSEGAPPPLESLPSRGTQTATDVSHTWHIICRVRATLPHASLQPSPLPLNYKVDHPLVVPTQFCVASTFFFSFLHTDYHSCIWFFLISQVWPLRNVNFSFSLSHTHMKS
ncbi:hypothetical protein KP509_36G000300 [Ceratopteris richardii]|uniref:Uncharacterized protein n=1 Tax=Ceratopteris richardii TaxID=49495 RepID=A0A8T2QA72_CERRI|nr:hypothetical protein KP509_36G000300 [Ceratopteris richardii]